MYFNVYRDSSLQWRWRLYASNGRIIADSGEGYVNKVDCYAGIALVKQCANAPTKES